jgi:hypothetical protein
MRAYGLPRVMILEYADPHDIVLYGLKYHKALKSRHRIRQAWKGKIRTKNKLLVRKELDEYIRYAGEGDK